MLTSSGLEIADSYGVKTYATASPAGLNVYTRLGFQIVETVSTDYTQFGGTSRLSIILWLGSLLRLPFIHGTFPHFPEIDCGTKTLSRNK